MSESWEPSVCDLTAVMRVRLFCGLYNKRAVPPRWRRLAQAYCITVACALLIYIYLTQRTWAANYNVLRWIPTTTLYYLAFFVSLWTGDEYVNTFFTQNKITDFTLDSPNILRRVQVQIKQAVIGIFVIFFTNLGLNAVLYRQVSIKTLMLLILPTVAIEELVLSFYFVMKMPMMALFNARMLILKRRLQRYGFRTPGRAQPQPYCRIYNEVWKSLDASNNPLKILLFVDIGFNCYRITRVISFYYGYGIQPGALGVAVLGAMILALVGRLTFSFGHVAMLEEAAAHCEDMAIFTVTQLIKNPTAIERRRMLDFLDPLEQRGARYHVMRAVQLDARFVLRALSFCCTQIILSE